MDSRHKLQTMLAVIFYRLTVDQVRPALPTVNHFAAIIHGGNSALAAVDHALIEVFGQVLDCVHVLKKGGHGSKT